MYDHFAHFLLLEMESTWVNLKKNTFSEIPTKWYNLRSSRFIAGVPKYSPVYSLSGIRVLGTMEDIEKFWQLNKERIAFLHLGKSLESLLFQPFENVIFQCYDVDSRTQSCFTNAAAPVFSNNVETLTDDQLNSIYNFGFGGLFVKGKVCKVIDGDTFLVAFFAPVYMLSRMREGDNKTPIIPLSGSSDTQGFFTKVHVRLYGYDAAEKNTEPGKLAKRLMEEKILSISGIVWCQFIDPFIAEDKYGRTLAVLYEDEERKILLNDYLLREERTMNIKMVFPYLGGTKKAF